MQKHIEDAVSVFVPTTPNPTSGLIVIVPRQRIIELQMTVDQAFTYILSAGSVGPDVTTIEGLPVSTLPNRAADAAPVGSGGPDRVAGP
jgi:uncharacterized membrane protein